MKYLIALILLCTSFTASAMTESECVQLGGIYRSVAHMRDRGLTPQEILQFSQGAADSIKLNQKEIKKIINLVYFDAGFARAGGMALQVQIYNVCMGKYKPMEKLK